MYVATISLFQRHKIPHNLKHVRRSRAAEHKPWRRMWFQCSLQGDGRVTEPNSSSPKALLTTSGCFPSSHTRKSARAYLSLVPSLTASALLPHARRRWCHHHLTSYWKAWSEWWVWGGERGARQKGGLDGVGANGRRGDAVWTEAAENKTKGQKAHLSGDPETSPGKARI